MLRIFFFRRVNSTASIEHDIFKNSNYNSDSDEDSPDEETKKKLSNLKIGRIDISPEAEKKRQEAYEKWLNSVM